MIITNKTLGWAIIIILWLFSTYGVYEYWAIEDEIEFAVNGVMYFISHIAFFIGIVVLITRLLDDEIEFEFEIPNPFSQAIRMYKEKKEAAQAIEGIYMKIAKAEKNEEVDILLKKLEAIKGNKK